MRTAASLPVSPAQMTAMANEKRNVRIAGRPTSISAEPQFWTALQAIARSKNITIDALVTNIAKGRPLNLSSAVRLFVLDHYRDHVAELIGKRPLRKE
jgi:predicted DNA-binding ribbon-helix-helix protein